MHDAPKEFREHIDHITSLANLIEDDAVKVQLLDAIEILVNGMNGPWHGARVGWQWGDVPDTVPDTWTEDGLFDA